MNAEQVVQKIMSQARAEADKILAAAREAAGKEKQRLDQELSVFASETSKAAEAAGQDKLARMLAAARMQNAGNCWPPRVSFWMSFLHGQAAH